MNQKDDISENNQRNGYEDNLNKNNNINNNDGNINNKINQEDISIKIESNFKSAYYQYLNNNNNCSLSNKSKDKETKSKQTKYLVGNNEILNHLIYFTNSSNKSGVFPGSNS